ncbi:MAG: AAA family ATPase [Fimbriimonadia bacterium]|nr:AAA family ATPase [Fimbriimonadia bacterium]
MKVYPNPNTQRFLNRLHSVKTTGQGWMARCPAHEDKTPSLSISEGQNGTILIKCFAGCLPEAIMKALGLTLKDLYPEKGTATHLKPSPITLDSFAKAKRLPVDFLRGQGIREGSFSGNPALVFEYRDSYNNFLFERYRISLEAGGYRQPKGKQTAPYGLWRLPQQSRSLFLVEGESDALTLWYIDYPALGIPGGNHWRSEYWQFVAPYNKIRVWMEPDQGGKALIRAIRNTCPADLREQVEVWQPDGKDQGKDVSELWLKCEGQQDAFLQTMKTVKRVPLSTIAVGANETDQEAFAYSETICLKDVKPEPIQWLWMPYIPIGKITLLVGDPGVGKSFLSLKLAASVSRGIGEFGLKLSKPGTVLLWSAEDGASDTIRPRLDAMGANIGRIHLQQNLLSFTPSELRGTGDYERGLEQLEYDLEKLNPTLCIIDPYAAFIHAKLNSNAAPHMRAISKRLSELAERHDCAILIIAHLNKNQSSNALYRVSGSLDIPAAARSMLLVAEHPNEQGKVILTHAKSNNEKKGQSLAYTVHNGHFEWIGAVDLNTRDLFGKEEGTSMSEAIEFLESILADGGRPSKEILIEAKKLGISKSTLERAKRRLKIESQKGGMKGTWLWGLPLSDDDETEKGSSKILKIPEDTQIQNVTIFDESEYLRLSDDDETEKGSSKILKIPEDTQIQNVTIFDESEYLRLSDDENDNDELENRLPMIDDSDIPEDWSETEYLRFLAAKHRYPTLEYKQGHTITNWELFLTNKTDEHERALRAFLTIYPDGKA